MRLALKSSLTVAVLALIFAVAAWADVPTHMTVQGRLADSNGVPQAPGAVRFTFRLFDAELGGSQIWPANGTNGEEQIIVLGDGGLWTAALGTDSALTEAVFLDTTRWLEVTVDNFVDPAEALPRTKLNTSPYTFRAAQAATVQTVDGATGGSLTGDLDVDSVLEVVTSSSFVGVNRSSRVTGSEFFGVRSPTGPGAYGGMYLDTEDSTGRPFYGYATNGSAKMWHYYEGLTNTWHLFHAGNRISVMNNGNVGIGNGAPSYRLDVNGGDFRLTNPATAGDGSVVLPVDAISNSEILDEPGLAASPTGGFIALTTTRDTFQTVTITCPSSGYVVIICEIELNNGTANTYVDGRLYRTGGTLLNQWDWDAGDVDGFYDQTQTKHVVDVVTAGAVTYYLDMNMSSGTANTIEARLIALFFPTAYGSVSAGAPPLGGDTPELSANDAQVIPAPRELNVEAQRQESIEANLARMERELAEMRALVAQSAPVTNARTDMEPVGSSQWRDQ